jgi:hypothetical protein
VTTPTLRPLSLGEVLDTSLALYRRCFRRLLGVSFATQAVPWVLVGFLDAAGGFLLHPGLYVVQVLIAVVLAVLGTAASTFIVSEYYLGRSISTRQALRTASGFLGRLITLSLATGLVVGCGFVAPVIPLMLLLFIGNFMFGGGGSSAAVLSGAVVVFGAMIGLLVGATLLGGLIIGTPALVLENLPDAPNAMRRSWALSRGYRRKLLGAYVLGFLVLLVPTVAIGWIASSVGVEAATFSVTGFLLELLQALLAILIYPFLYVLSTVNYYDMRVRKEGFDLEMLASSLRAA